MYKYGLAIEIRLAYAGKSEFLWTEKAVSSLQKISISLKFQIILYYE